MPDGGPQPVSRSFIPGPETARDFRSALGCFSTGVTVVTCATPDGPIGITVNSFASVSLDPPLVLWSAAKGSSRYAAFAGASHFVIHIMGADQEDIAAGFARAGHAFDGVRWSENTDGAPVIADCLAHFECATDRMHDGGDHTIILGRVRRVSCRDGDPLLFALGKFGRFMGCNDL
jgi:flavin reductase (DIM6/NTAB) family NADH-FMN oxidoreductase RutF